MHAKYSARPAERRHALQRFNTPCRSSRNFVADKAAAVAAAAGAVAAAAAAAVGAAAAAAAAVAARLATRVGRPAAVRAARPHDRGVGHRGARNTAAVAAHGGGARMA
jgi:hypothetical protein